MDAKSSDYFRRVAEDWDTLQKGYFTAGVREAAIARAGLSAQMVVADVGAGTGYLTAGLAPFVARVHAIDGSPEMLAVARRNLAGLTNVEFQEADGRSLPLPDAAVDAVFANMYLHHTPDPAAAIAEMARVLKPGGRLVIADGDKHDHAWMRDEMADVWLGFDRDQLGGWLADAGLVDIGVDGAGEHCCGTSAAGAAAKVTVFVAVANKPVAGAKESVRARYGALAQQSPCCAPSCCSPNYSSAQLQSVPAEAAGLSLGCGNPVLLAGLLPGEVVLDIGSGAGLDAFLAAQPVGPAGLVIGLDMTDAMLERARRAAAAAGCGNVEFRKGDAENMPVADGTVDVIMSNCVINLTPDKGKVFREAYRVLKPGGRLAISDIVTDKPYPPDVRGNLSGWSTCVTGALPESQYLGLIAAAGFRDISVRPKADFATVAGVRPYSIDVRAFKR